MNDRAGGGRRARPERLVVLEMGGHGSFVRHPELCLSVFGRL
jgi:hypothetical protein